MFKLLIKSTYRIAFLLIILSAVTPSNVYAEQLQNKQDITLTILSGQDNCSKTKDAKAPCRSEVFTIEPLTKSTTTSVTCGINI